MLGILASTALPRFIDLSEDAKLARFASIRSGFRISAKNVQLLAITEQSRPGTYPGSVELLGSTVDINPTEGWSRGLQANANCTPLAFIGLDDVMIAVLGLLKVGVDSVLGVSPAYAGGGGGILLATEITDGRPWFL